MLCGPQHPCEWTPKWQVSDFPFPWVNKLLACKLVGRLGALGTLTTALGINGLFFDCQWSVRTQSVFRTMHPHGFQIVPIDMTGTGSMEHLSIPVRVKTVLTKVYATVDASKALNVKWWLRGAFRNMLHTYLGCILWHVMNGLVAALTSVDLCPHC